MGKYDHICELTGADNYSRWRLQMTLALQGERLWNHCSIDADPEDYVEFASTLPTPLDPTKVTATERESILDWLAKDAQAKALINRKISTSISSLLSISQTTREQWAKLAQQFSRLDILSQYELRTRVRTENSKMRMMLRVFEEARRRFIEMGVTYTAEEAVYDLLQGLPEGLEWNIFREITLTKLQSQSSLGTSSGSDTAAAVTFEEVSKLLVEKGNVILGRRKVAPGSGYANVVAPKPVAKVNPATGVKIHSKDPSSVRCVNISCVGKPRADSHDITHCYWPGGGMESQAPAWLRNRAKEAPAVATPVSSSVNPSASSLPSLHKRDSFMKLHAIRKFSVVKEKDGSRDGMVP